MARKLPGVEDVIHNRKDNTLLVYHSGDQENIKKICEYVHRIGYEATPQS